MHPGEFSDESKVKLKSLENKYSGCNINLIDMSDKYKNAYDKDFDLKAEIRVLIMSVSLLR